jgi:Sodium Bile acid symporter family
MMAVLQHAVPIATLVFVVSSMLAMGLGLTISQITAPLRNVRLVAMSLLANFVLMPATAVLLARVLRLDEPFGVGLLLLGVAAGAPFLPKLAQIAKGDLAFAVALMVVLMVITVGYLPLVLPRLLPGVSVNPGQIARSLIMLMLLPLAAALAVKASLPSAAAAGKPWCDRPVHPRPGRRGAAAGGRQLRRCGVGVRHPRHPGRTDLHRLRLRRRLGTGRPNRRHPARTRLGYRPTQHRRSTSEPRSLGLRGLS